MNIYHAEILKVKYFQVKRTTEKEARVMNCFCGMFKRQKHCVKSVRIRSYSGPHFPAFSHIRTEFSPNLGKCGKNADQSNSEYGDFLRSESVKTYLQPRLLSGVLTITYLQDAADPEFRFH